MNRNRRENQKGSHGLIASLKGFVEYLGDKRIEIMGTRELELAVKNSLIAQAVVPEFDYVAEIDIEDGTFKAYYFNREKKLAHISKQSYQKAVVDICRRDAAPEDRERIADDMQIENVLQKLENNDEYIIYADQVEADGTRRNKKLRFCYPDGSRRKLLLSRTDVSDVIKERRLREAEEKKRIQYLDNMPVAFCSIEVLLNEAGRPYDFRFTYCNSAHEELEGVKHGELTGKTFYEFFNDTDQKWLDFYYDTAFNGNPHVIKRFSPEIRKELLIYTFCTERGHCECVLMDITKEWRLDNELMRSRREMKRILETTTSLVFKFDALSDVIKMDDGYSLGGLKTVSSDDITGILAENATFSRESAERFKDILNRAKKGEHLISEIIRARLKNDEGLCYYRVTLLNFDNGYDIGNNILGYFRNIDSEMHDRKRLEREAETEPLTGLLNSGAGKARINRILDEGCTAEDSSVRETESLSTADGSDKEQQSSVDRTAENSTVGQSAEVRSDDAGSSDISGGNDDAPYSAVCSSESRAGRVKYAMFMLDMDDFKSINDTWGHLIGDNVLRHFADILRETFRQEDIVFRLGGDEFAVFMQFTGDITETVNKIMERFRESVAKARERYPFLSTSVGVYASDRKQSFEHFYQEADKALYQIKKNGKDGFNLIIEE